MTKILIVEDDTTFATILDNFLNRNGFKVVLKNSVKTAIEALSSEDFQLLLLDYRLGDGIGMDVVEFNLASGKSTPVIIMTSFNDVRTAVKAIRKGVHDYITKPVNPDELLMVLREALQDQSSKTAAGYNGSVSGKEDKPVKKNISKLDPAHGTAASDFVEGRSKISRKLHEYITLVAPTDMSILIRGESGTGKEYVARSIHMQSKRASKPFVSIDCGTLSKELASSELFGHVKGSFTGALQDKTGQFLEASGGTLFLDEIGNLSYDVQVKLLRALQEKVIQPVGGNKLIEVDVRILAATNEDLVGSFVDGKFREDLYHRINEFEIVVPALRDREEDFDEFVRFFIQQSNEELDKKVTKLDDRSLDILKQYDWPGNLRELKNIVKRMILLSSGSVAGIESLPSEMVDNIFQKQRTSPLTAQLATHAVGPGEGLLTPVYGFPMGTSILEVDLKTQSEAHERNLIIEALVKSKYNKSKAAKMLQIDRKTLYNKIEKYGIE